MKQQAVASDAVGEEKHGLRRDAVRASDLAETATGDQLVENNLVEVGSLEPIGCPESLLAEMTTAVSAAVTLDAVGLGLALEEAVLDEAPAGFVAVELA